MATLRCNQFQHSGRGLSKLYHYPLLTGSLLSSTINRFTHRTSRNEGQTNVLERTSALGHRALQDRAALGRGQSGPLNFQGQDANKLYIHEGISEACGNELTASTTATKGVKSDWVGLGSPCS